MSYIDIMIFGSIINILMIVFDLIYAFLHIIPRNHIVDKIRIESLFIKREFLIMIMPFSGILNTFIIIYEFKKYQKKYPGSDSLDFYYYRFKKKL